MSDSKINYINPYATLAQQHRDGLDAIITSIGTGGPGTVSLDDLMDAVYDFLSTVYTDFSSPEGENTLRAAIANAINGYLDNGGSSPYLSVLQSVPLVGIGNLFDRLFDASKAAAHLKGNAGRQQMVLALGEANGNYWGNQIESTGAWTAYMFGNVAIDMLSVPYWVDAAMFGAQFDYYQVDATDSSSNALVFPSALAGSLAVAAGKVVFGWAPRTQPTPTSNGSESVTNSTNWPEPNIAAKEFKYSCTDLATGESFENSIDAEDVYFAQAALNHMTAGTALACRLYDAL